MRRRFLALSLITLLSCWVPVFSEEASSGQSVYDFSLVDMNGKVVPLSTYKGKVLLIVNLASQSIYYDQVSALNELAKAYESKGLVVIGIPSFDFGGKELKDPAALRQYYSDTMHVSFPVFAPATLHGVETIPLYVFLCNPKESVSGEDIHWNFTKFIVDRDGKPLARFELSEDPADPTFHVTIESALEGKLKRQKPEEKREAHGDDDDDD
ncbi:glutathione peroxidase [Acidobacteria bacterium AB60]|nr:glutathione peroxidase [Acidobacteria bacterium AB60]